MRKFSSLSILSVVGVAALCAGACSSSSSKSDGGSTGTGGTGAGGTSGGDPLIPSATGFVDDVTTGVIGAWYAYGDGAGSNANATNNADMANSDCIKAGFTADQCSQIVTPTPGMPFAPMGTAKMCTNGTAAQVLPKPGTTTADFSDLFGAGIGLDFNNPGGDAGAKGFFDMTPYTGVSFDFTAPVLPANKMRVNFPFMGEHNGTDSPYWDGATMDHSPLADGTHVVIHWADVGGPLYLTTQMPPTVPPPFLKQYVASIQFQVFTNVNTPTPYSFCVDNLTLLTQ
jgi:hypothetical protein